ncbi:TraB/GumN family protein [Sphingoaurantiacus capsulatus]|uniref:TraB/GumN family protein n=1 Tax=Sphingoaurantiacus capsulatus TaxID=1771310 RepID=A0ABV7X839_9SPHN
MIRRTLVALLLSAVVVPTAHAAPALWKVSDADTTIYLFGSVHALPPGIPWYDGEIRTAFEKSDTLVLEMIAPKNEADLAPVMMALGFSDGHPPLAQRVAPPERPRLTTAAREAGIATQTLNAMETWLATLMLSMQQFRSLGLDGRHGVEKQLTTRAESARKRIVGLETVAEQMGYFDKLPEPDQRAFLTATLKQWPDMKARMRGMIDSWAKGDDAAIGTEMTAAMKETPRLAKVLMTDRNTRWASWIKGRMAQPGTVFVAVGAGHLAGPDSVQAVLARGGLKAERVE